MPANAYLCADEITVASGGTFTASNPTDVCVTPIGAGDVSLPVTLTLFNADTDEITGHVLLTWITESEIENLGFILERKQNTNEDWSEIESYITNTNLQGQGSVSHQTVYAYADKTVEEKKTYDYRLADVSYAGVKEYHVQDVLGVYIEEILPEEFALYQNYPNPFNPSTTIRYGIPEEAQVSLTIYDIHGRVVNTIQSGEQKAGYYNFTWNGLDSYNKPVSTGMYFTQLHTDSYSKVIKMVYVK